MKFTQEFLTPYYLVLFSVKARYAMCIHCRSLTPPHPAQARGRIPTPPAPFPPWGTDLVRPFHHGQCGRTYLLACIDHLAGWAEAIPIPTNKGTTVQQPFMDSIVARYGIPTVLISDNGGEFTSQAFEHWHQTSPDLTLPANPMGLLRDSMAQFKSCY